jgi:6-pyruvoyltetrahydropterin/6-carboxytetrahydropterin synthase
MYEVSVEGHFDAAHFLRDYGGKCENLHGHRFKVVVSLRAKKLDKIGLAYDFTELKRHLNDVLSKFDHTSVNEVPPFDKINPSSENIATEIYRRLKKRISGDVTVSSVEVWESPESRVTYTPD